MTAVIAYTHNASDLLIRTSNPLDLHVTRTDRRQTQNADRLIFVYSKFTVLYVNGYQ